MGHDEAVIDEVAVVPLIEVDAARVIVRRFAKGGELGANVDIYNLIKYQRTNQNTCFNQKPIVTVGDRI